MPTIAMDSSSPQQTSGSVQLVPRTFDGQFSDADENSPDSHRECPTLPADVQPDVPETSWDSGEEATANQESIAEHQSYYSTDSSEDANFYPNDEYSDTVHRQLTASSDHSYVMSATDRVKGKRFTEGKFSSRICIDDFSHKKETEGSRALKKDQNAQRKTIQNVFDQRTICLISSFFHKEYIGVMLGCISTGKEAAVYYCKEGTYGETALKIFKTSIMGFKNRDKYVTGDFKFRSGYCKSSSGKLVKLWAEKEFANLHKLHSNGLPVPKPLRLKDHILLMEFLGNDDYPAPLLKNVDMSPSKARKLYEQIIRNMWIIFRQCKMVHADLSEFNMLYHNDQAYIIDVSQSVSHNHPESLNFLRKDCSNITEFFKKKGVDVLYIRELFMYIVDANVHKGNSEEYLQFILMKASERDPYDMSEEEQTNEAVFKKMFLPRDLSQVVDFERDLSRQKTAGKGEMEEIHYQAILGMKRDLSGAATQPQLFADFQIQSKNENADEQENEESNDASNTTNSNESNTQASASNEEASNTASNTQQTSKDQTNIEDTDSKKNVLAHRDRPKNETAEEKKLRKQEVKQQQKGRRVGKKDSQEDDKRAIRNKRGGCLGHQKKGGN